MTNNKHTDSGASEAASTEPTAEQLQARVAYLEARLVKVSEEGAALAAHVERWKSAYIKLTNAEQTQDADTDEFMHLATGDLMAEFDAIAEDATTASITRRDLTKQAEALEEAASDCVAEMHQMANWLRARAAAKRQQAQESRS